MASRRDFLLMCAVASGVPLVAPDPRQAAGADVAKKGGTLRVGFYIEAATMDPHFSGSKIDRQVYHNIYEPLVTLDVKLGIKPGLAESWAARISIGSATARSRTTRSSCRASRPARST